MDEQKFNELVNELIECSEGKRGWVCMTKVRARRIGVSHDLMLGSALALSLKVMPPHGRMGWTATR